MTELCTRGWRRGDDTRTGDVEAWCGCGRGKKALLVGAALCRDGDGRRDERGELCGGGALPLWSRGAQHSTANAVVPFSPGPQGAGRCGGCVWVVWGCVALSPPWRWRRRGRGRARGTWTGGRSWGRLAWGRRGAVAFALRDGCQHGREETDMAEGGTSSGGERRERACEPGECLKICEL